MSNQAGERYLTLPDATFRLGNVRAWCEKGNGRLIVDLPPRPLQLTKPRLFGPISRPTIIGPAQLPARYVAELPNCRIWGGSRLVFVGDDLVLHDEMALPYADQYGVKLAQLFKAKRKAALASISVPQEQRHIEAGILISSDYDQNYFHWMIECLPKFLLAEDCPGLHGLPLIIDGGVHQNMGLALQYLDKTGHPVVSVARGELVSVGRLIVPSDVSRLLDNYDYPVSYQRDCVFDAGAIRRVAATLLEAVAREELSSGRGIYISRRRAKNRKPINEQVLIDLALGAGLDVVEMEGLSLQEQINLFRNAEFVVTPTGAACTNLIFCRPGTNILIMTSDDPNSNFQIFHQVGQAVDCKVTYLVSQRDMRRPGPALHGDYAVDPRVFKAALVELSGK